MRSSVYSWAVALLGLWLSAGDAGATPVSVDAVAPGTRGEVHTVVRGDAIEKIPVRFIGTLEGALGPDRDLYVVELEGPIAETVGVAAGMSGSPVYVNGRIVGALAYRYGVIPKSPIGGVTPIEQMLDSSRTGASRPDATGGSGPSPIATPIVVGGLETVVREWLAPQLEEHGFVAVAGGARSRGDDDPSPPAPGKPIGVRLVGGDLTIAATGTVTWVDEKTVYAFGHPFFGAGRVNMPMTSVEVVHTLADMAGSFKMTNLGGDVGAVLEDRLGGIVGKTGATAPVIPVEVRVRGGTYGEQRFRYEVVRHPDLVPLMVAAVASHSLVNNSGFDSALTLLGTGTVRLRGMPALPIELAFSGDSTKNPAIAAASRIQALLGRLYRNPFGLPDPESIELEFDVTLDATHYTVESLLYDRGPIAPGEERTFECVLRGYRGNAARVSFSISVPEGVAAGTDLRLAVGDGTFVDRALGRTISKQVSSARDLPALIRALAELQSEHRLTAVLFRSTGAVVSDGVLLTDLPGSARRLLEGSASEPSSGTGELLRVGRELDGPVTGGKLVKLTVGRSVDTEGR